MTHVATLPFIHFCHNQLCILFVYVLEKSILLINDCTKLIHSFDKFLIFMVLYFRPNINNTYKGQNQCTHKQNIYKTKLTHISTI